MAQQAKAGQARRVPEYTRPKPPLAMRASMRYRSSIRMSWERLPESAHGRVLCLRRVADQPSSRLVGARHAAGLGCRGESGRRPRRGRVEAPRRGAAPGSVSQRRGVRRGGCPSHGAAAAESRPACPHRLLRPSTCHAIHPTSSLPSTSIHPPSSPCRPIRPDSPSACLPPTRSIHSLAARPLLRFFCLLWLFGLPPGPPIGLCFPSPQRPQRLSETTAFHKYPARRAEPF